MWDFWDGVVVGMMVMAVAVVVCSALFRGRERVPGE